MEKHDFNMLKPKKRSKLRLKAGRLIEDEEVVENHAIMMYNPLIESR